MRRYNMIIWFLLLLFLYVSDGVMESARVEESSWINGSVSNGAVWTVAFELGENTSKAIRITTVSTDASLTYPVFISIRQGRHITSWTLPYVEAGHAFSSVGRTLCPILNQPLHDNSSHLVYADISSPAHINISFSILAEFVANYELKYQTPINVAVTPSSPVIYVFNYPVNIDHVLVKITSNDTSLCAIASVQNGLCPTDQLLDFPEHRGTYQTMQKLAAINYKRPVYQDYIYIVINIYYQYHCNDISKDLIDGLVTLNVSANYDPIHVSENNYHQQVKNVTIVIDHTLPVTQYWIGMVTSAGILLVFFLTAVFWTLISEYCCYHLHPAYKLFVEFEQQQKERECGGEGGEKGDGEDEDKVEKGNKEESGHRAVDRPNFLAFVTGNHLLSEMERRSTCNLSPRSPEFINHEFARALNKVNPLTRHHSVSDSVMSTPSRVPLVLRKISSSNNNIAESVDQQLPLDTEYVTRSLSSSSVGVETITCSTEKNAVINVGRDNVINGGGDKIINESIDNGRPIRRQRYLSYHEAIAEDEVCECETEVVVQTQTHATFNETMFSTEDNSPRTSTPVHEPHPPFDRRYLSMPYKFMHELNIPEGKELQKKYEGYWMYLIVLLLFYSIPVYQLVLTYQKYLQYSGNEDFCYYNTLCSHPLGIFSSFNNIWSNIGFFTLGLLFLIIASRRRSMYRFYDVINEHYENLGKPEAKLGVPQHFGIYYAVGVSLMGEAIMSAAYHICPTGNNYQFDTTMMFVLVTIGLYQLYKCRSPDIHPSPHKLLLVLAVLIFFIGMGVLYSSYIVFYVVFFIVFEAAVLYTTIQNYYRWKFKLYPLRCAREVLKELLCSNLRHPCPPQHKPKFIYFVVANCLNFISGIYGLIYRPSDFATYFLAIMIMNFILSLGYYGLVKLCYKEFRHRKAAVLKPVLYFILSISFWASGAVLYNFGVTDWLESPSGSRNNNQECVVLGFFDTHDLWHFLSSFALFFSFLLLMTLDDNQEFVNRSKLRVF